MASIKTSKITTSSMEEVGIFSSCFDI